jgi:ribose transport system substrate-binding protein
VRKAMVVICGIAMLFAIAACGSSGGSSSSSEAEPETGEAATAAAENGSQEAAGGKEEGTGKGARLAFFAPVPNGFIQAAEEGAEEGAEKAGGKVETSFAANGNLTLQTNQIQDAVASKKYDGLLIYPLAPQIAPAVEEAIAAGLKVGIVENSMAPTELLQNYEIPGMVISSVEPLADRVKGLDEMTVEACEGKEPCEVAYLMGIQQNPVDVAILKGWEEGLKGHSNIEVVATSQGMYEVDPARSAAQDILSAHSGLDVFVTNADIMTEGAELAGEAAGDSEIQYIGVGASEKGCAAVKEGKWLGTTNSVPHDSGMVAGEAVAEAVISGKKAAEPMYDPLKASGLPLSSTKATASECPGQWGF